MLGFRKVNHCKKKKKKPKNDVSLTNSKKGGNSLLYSKLISKGKVSKVRNRM